MLNKTLVAAAMAGAVGLAGSAFAQDYGTKADKPAPEPKQIVVSERVISENPTVIERQVVVGVRAPERNTGISKIGGTVGGAIGGYYINGTTAAENLPLDIPRDADSYTR